MIPVYTSLPPDTQLVAVSKKRVLTSRMDHPQGYIWFIWQLLISVLCFLRSCCSLLDMKKPAVLVNGFLQADTSLLFFEARIWPLNLVENFFISSRWFFCTLTCFFTQVFLITCHGVLLTEQDALRLSLYKPKAVPTFLSQRGYNPSLNKDAPKRRWNAATAKKRWRSTRVTAP